MTSSTVKVWQSAFRVNTTDAPTVGANAAASSEQSKPYVMGLSGGGFVIGFEDWSTAFSGLEPRDILAQSFDISGTKLGAEAYLSSGWQDDDQRQVTLSPYGSGYRATFGSGDNNLGDKDNIYGTAFTASGGWLFDIDMREPLGANQVRTGTNQRDPFSIRLSDGSLAVFYTDDATDNNPKLMLRGWTQATFGGVQTTVEFGPIRADQTATAVKAPEAVALASGKWAVAYEDAGDIKLLRGTSFSALGAPVFVANTTRAESDAQIAVLKSGATVVSWTDAGGDGSGAGIKARIYSATNTAGTTFTVNDITAGAQSESDIVALKDGGFLIAWRDEQADTIRAQQYSAAGAKLGSSILLASGGVDDPSLGVLKDGRVVLSYTKTVAGNADVMATILDPRSSAGAGTSGKDVLVALPAGTALSGLAADDTLIGGRGADTLSGGTENDLLRGNGGADRLVGGAGRDDLAGGAGADRFVFARTTDLTRVAGATDVIRDFAPGTDKIDLSAIDAIRATTTVNEAFRFAAAQASTFSGRSGELHWWQDAASGKTFVAGDVNGDRAADFLIELSGLVTLSATDFIL